DTTHTATHTHIHTHKHHTYSQTHIHTHTYIQTPHIQPRRDFHTLRTQLIGLSVHQTLACNPVCLYTNMLKQRNTFTCGLCKMDSLWMEPRGGTHTHTHTHTAAS